MKPIVDAMRKLGAGQAQALAVSDYSVANLRLLQGDLKPRSSLSCEYLRASAYFGEVLRRDLSGEWIPSSSSNRSRSGAPQIQIGKWTIDPLYQVQIALEENAEMALDQRAQFIIEAVREGKESEALNRSYEFPTAWQRIRSAMRAYRYQSLVFRCAGQEDDNVVDFLP